MNVSSPQLIRWRLAQLASHLVVALIALVVIGGSTRVMEAGLACPDWPLCYGSFLPGRQMNVQVFLEWFHRLDAFLIGIAFLIQFVVALIFKSALPKWLTWVYGIGLFLVIVQGVLGGLTVLQLLPSGVVTAHLALALTLVALMSGVSQRLLQSKNFPAPDWWRYMGCSSLLLVLAQCLLGGRMATTWSSQSCVHQGSNCHLLDLHMISALIVSTAVVIFILIAMIAGGWTRSQWPFLIFALFLLAMQIVLGIASVHLELSKPIVTVGHQLTAALLVASLSALSFRRPEAPLLKSTDSFDETIMEACHG